MPRSDFEERQMRRRKSLLDRAAKAEAEAQQAEDAARHLGQAIPFGQPILVGHHSEKRHRRDLERIERGYRKAHELRVEAKELRRRAEAVGTAGISSDDLDAETKLHAKIEELEQLQERRKAVNAAWRKAGKPAPDAGADAWQAVREVARLSAEDLRALRLEMAQRWSWQPGAPYPAYAISNTNSELRRLRVRIAELGKQSSAQHVDEDHGVCRLVEAPDDNRVRLLFSGKPEEHVRALLKQWGFRWSPQASAWQRHLNDAGRVAARAVIERLRNEVVTSSAVSVVEACERCGKPLAGDGFCQDGKLCGRGNEAERTIASGLEMLVVPPEQQSQAAPAAARYVCPDCGSAEVELCFPVWVLANDIDDVARWQLDVEASPEKDSEKGWCPSCSAHVLVRKEGGADGP